MGAGVSFGPDAAALPGAAVGARVSGVVRMLNAPVVAAFALASLSVAAQGFLWGIANNAFQAPIALGLPQLPQFQGDWYYQSLSAYCSALWPLLGALGLGGPAAFLVLHLLARTASFACMWLLLKRFGLTALDRWLAMLVIATSLLLTTPSPVGGQAFLDNYFSQDAVVWAMSLATWLLVVDRRYGAAVAMTGPTFAVAAFMAVWNAFALAVVGAVDVVAAPVGERLRRLRLTAVKGALGGALALAIAAPVIVWAARTAIDRPHPPFDYAAFLWAYYPKHFFIAASSHKQVWAIASLAAAGAVALWRLGQVARPLVRLYVGYGLLFVIGAALPWFTHARALLNLHLLRVDDGLVVMAVLACVATGLKDLRHGGGFIARACGALVLFEASRGFTPTPVLALGVALPIVLERLRPAQAAAPGRTDLGLVAAGVALLASGIAAHGLIAAQTDGSHERIAAERRVGDWLQANTPPTASVLARAAVKPGLDELQLYSRRRVWIDWKRGAVAMWRPDLYPIWRQRVAEATALHTVDQAAAYACRNGVRYLVEPSAQLPARAPGAVVFADPYLSVIDLARACPASGVKAS